MTDTTPTIYERLSLVQEQLKAPKDKTATQSYSNRSEDALLEAANHIDYNPMTGEITRIERPSASGSIDAYGYLVIRINGLCWKAHRLAWAKHYGVAPIHNIDHIDRNKQNNRIANLRDVPQAINVINTHREPNPDTGVVGIYLDRVTNGLKAQFTTRFNGKTYRFRTLDEAIAARSHHGGLT